MSSVSKYTSPNESSSTKRACSTDLKEKLALQKEHLDDGDVLVLGGLGKCLHHLLSKP